jgi:hypothetical protein
MEERQIIGLISIVLGILIVTLTKNTNCVKKIRKFLEKHDDTITMWFVLLNAIFIIIFIAMNPQQFADLL